MNNVKDRLQIWIQEKLLLCRQLVIWESFLLEISKLNYKVSIHSCRDYFKTKTQNVQYMWCIHMPEKVRARIPFHIHPAGWSETSWKKKFCLICLLTGGRIIAYKCNHLHEIWALYKGIFGYPVKAEILFQQHLKVMIFLT